MNINIIHRDNNTTLFSQYDPSPKQLSILPIRDEIIEYDNSKYVVKQVIKKYEGGYIFSKKTMEITSIDIIVVDDTSGRCW